MRKRYLFVPVLLAGLIMNSCDNDLFCIDGNGLAETRVRRSSGFYSIENTTSIDVVYKKSDSTRITITADENLIDEIVTETDNNNLIIRTRTDKCLDFNTRPLITITAPSLQAITSTGSGSLTADEISGNSVNIKMSGSGDISVAKVEANTLKLFLSGSGNIKGNECTSVNSDIFLSGSGEINLAGQSENLTLKITGSGKINAESWSLGTADITITGSGDVFSFVENSLDAFLSGSGNIYLKGNPTINKTITGSGRIINY